MQRDGDDQAGEEGVVQRDGDDQAGEEGVVQRDGDDQADVDQPDSGAGEAGADDGVDTEHVMNLTFVLTLLLGVPVVVVLSLVVPLDGWNEIVTFVVQVGAAIWFLTALTLYVRERVRR